MKVRELRLILDHVPDDLDVRIISTWAGRGHINEVRRRTNTRWAPAALVLSDWPGQAADDYRLSGPFRRPDELLRALDPDMPEAEP